MKKLSLVLVLVLVLVFALVLTSVAEEDYSNWVTETRIGNPNAEITLNAWLQRDQTLRSPHESWVEYYKEAYLGWAKRHPNAKVMVHVSPAGEISAESAKLLLATEQGNGPDFAAIDSFWAGTFIKRGYLQPLDQFMTEQEQNDFFDFTKKITVSNGHQYALWSETDQRMLYYRKDWIKEPPRTWDELIKTALEMKEKHGVYGYLSKYGAEGALNENTWACYWAQGGEIFNEEGKPIFGEGKNREYMLNILKYDQRLIESGAMPGMCAGWTSFDPLLAEVKADNVAMFIEGSWAFSQIETLIGKEEANKKYGFAPYPQMKADQRSNSAGGWTRAIFTKDPVKQLLAFSFIWETEVSKQGMGNRTQITGHIPTRKSVLADYHYFQISNIQKFLAEELKYSGTRPGDNILYPDVSEALSTVIGKILIGRLDPEKALDEAYAQSLKAWERKKD